jgi:hypothetical protein
VSPSTHGLESGLGSVFFVLSTGVGEIQPFSFPAHVYVKMFGSESFDKVVKRWQTVETLILDESELSCFINGC